MLHAWRENVPGHRIRSVWWPLDVATSQKKKGKKTKKSHCSSFSCSKRVDHQFLWLYIYQPCYVMGLLLIHICEDANFMPDKVFETTIFSYNFCYKDNIFFPDIVQCFSENILTLLYIWLDLTQGACTYSVDSLRRKNSSSLGHPWHLWLVYPPPPPPEASNMIMSQSMHLAGLTHGEKSLTLSCFPTWGSNQSDKISPPQCLLLLTQKRLATHPLLGLGLSSLISPLDFFGYPGLMPVFKQKLRGHLLANLHRCIGLYLFRNWFRYLLDV